MAKASNCRLCGKRAVVGEVEVSYSGKTLFAVVCENDACRLSEMPRNPRFWRAERGWAIELWNGYGARDGSKKRKTTKD